jgi:arginine exporter protein ArgO
MSARLNGKLLAGVAAGTALLWFLLLANVVTALRRFLTAAKVRRTIDAVTGTILVAVGLRIAVSS